MPCRVPKRRFSCGAPQHLTKNLILAMETWGKKYQALLSEEKKKSPVMNLSSFLTGDFCHLSMRGEISVTPSPLRGRNLLPPHKIKEAPPKWRLFCYRVSQTRTVVGS